MYRPAPACKDWARTAHEPDRQGQYPLVQDQGVVWEHVYSPTDHDIYMKQIDPAGNLRSLVATVLDGSFSNESAPQISKSDGPGFAADQRWVVAYQRTYTPSDEDIRGSLITWDGQLVQVGARTTSRSTSPVATMWRRVRVRRPTRRRVP
jgi:hypothetical protein